MKDARITRRQALGCVAALAALPQQALLGCGARTDRDRIIALRRDLHSAERLGRAWLDGQSPVPSAAALVALRHSASRGDYDFLDDGGTRFDPSDDTLPLYGTDHRLEFRPPESRAD